MEYIDCFVFQVTSFNMTMTYHRKSHIYVPYGNIVPKIPPEPKNYSQIIAKKTKSVLWVASNCNTFSWRERYVKELSKYIQVDILGECSENFEPWTCGLRHHHDDCFSILNEYKYFLAFENSLCEDYVTEKFYENFDYDTVLVARGGTGSNLKELLPDGTYVDTDAFNTPKELAMHLRTLMNDVPRYQKILEEKNKFRNVPYGQLYQQALCDLCDRISFPEQFHIEGNLNIREYFHESNFCRLPVDVPTNVKIH